MVNDATSTGYFVRRKCREDEPLLSCPGHINSGDQRLFEVNIPGLGKSRPNVPRIRRVLNEQSLVNVDLTEFLQPKRSQDISRYILFSRCGS
jgi:hypothetical protein